MPSAITALRRGWWFPDLPGYRSLEQGTYVSFALDEQPHIEADEELAWLETQPEVPGSIIAGDPGQQIQPLMTETLATTASGLVVPPSLRKLAARPDLQRRVRSVTACYLDLGDMAVPTSIPTGHLVHFLSDQQWCLHWLLYVDGGSTEAVVVTDMPIGFALDEDDWDEAPPDVVPMDGSLFLEVCADSFAEFLRRFWIENELWLALQRGGPLPPHLKEYASRLPLAST